MTQPDPSHFVSVGKPGGLQARINLHGAQLWQFIDRDGTDLLWSGDPAVWSGRAPILFPIIGSLAGDAYRYRDASYTLHRHGFARHAMFTLVEAGDDSALLRLEADDESRKVYPFEFRLDLRFTCTANGLEVAVGVRNPGDDDLPFSFGFHPALRWPLEPGGARSDHAITFAAPEAAPISKLDAQGLIMPQRQPSPVDGRTLALYDELFAGDALIFTDLASRSVDYGAQGHNGRHMRVDFDNLPLLGVWTKPGAGYICIEPWQGMADPEGFAGDILAKPGIITLAPEGEWQARMTLSPVSR
jgi:galactose mutarotase-like enzyme